MAILEGVSSLTSSGMIVAWDTRFKPKVMNMMSMRLTPKFQRKLASTWRSNIS